MENFSSIDTSSAYNAEQRNVPSNLPHCMQICSGWHLLFVVQCRRNGCHLPFSALYVAFSFVGFPFLHTLQKNGCCVAVFALYVDFLPSDILVQNAEQKMDMTSISMRISHILFCWDLGSAYSTGMRMSYPFMELYSHFTHLTFILHTVQKRVCRNPLFSLDRCWHLRYSHIMQVIWTLFLV